MLGVSNATLVRWADTDRLNSVRTPGGQRRYRAADVEQLRIALGRPVVAPPLRPPHPPIIRGQRRPLLSAGQVAQIIDVTPHTVRRWTLAGVLPATRTPGGHYRWSPDDVARLVAQYGLSANVAGSGNLPSPGPQGSPAASQSPMPDPTPPAPAA
jgi:excisionase family DNA binding protein